MRINFRDCFEMFNNVHHAETEMTTDKGNHQITINWPPIKNPIYISIFKSVALKHSGIADIFYFQFEK